MKTRFIAALAALALLLSSVAPAQAIDKEDAQALAIILGTIAIGAAISNNSKKKNSNSSYASRNWRYDDDYDDDHRHKSQRKRALPASCAYPIGLHGQRRDVMSRRCLADHGIDRRLPAECAFTVRDSWGRHDVYGVRCLQRYGYVIDNGRRRLR